MNNDELLQYVLDNNPHARGNNTEILIAMYKYVAESRGVYIDPTMWDIMRQYKPESVVRKRRKKVESTPEQREKEQEYKHAYSPSSL